LRGLSPQGGGRLRLGLRSAAPGPVGPRPPRRLELRRPWSCRSARRAENGASKERPWSGASTDERRSGADEQQERTGQSWSPSARDIGVAVGSSFAGGGRRGRTTPGGRQRRGRSDTCTLEGALLAPKGRAGRQPPLIEEQGGQRMAIYRPVWSLVRGSRVRGDCPSGAARRSSTLDEDGARVATRASAWKPFLRAGPPF
jgi:hypothetical protein